MSLSCPSSSMRDGNDDSGSSSNIMASHRLSTSSMSSAGDYVNKTPSHLPPKLPPIPPKRDPPALPALLVTGGCGFIGAELLKTLLNKHPNIPITVIDLKPAPERFRHDQNIVFYQADLNDYSLVRRILENTRPGVIFHVAGIIPNPPVRDKKEFWRNNPDATKTLLQACNDVLVNGKKGCKLRAFIYASSCDSIKGRKELAGLDERTPYPTSFFDEFSETMAAAEALVIAENRPEFPTCALRGAGVVGARGQILNILYTSLVNKETAYQIGENKNLYDFVDIENYCAALLLAAYNFLTVPVPPNIKGSHDRSYDYVDQGHGDKDGNPISAAGHTFFITNMEPVYFYDWCRAVWAYLGDGINGKALRIGLEEWTEKERQKHASHSSSTEAGKVSVLAQNSSVKCKTSGYSSIIGAAIHRASNQMGFAFSPTTPLPEPYTPYSPPPPQFPEDVHYPAARVKISKGTGFALASMIEFYSTVVRGKEPGITKARVKECCYDRWFRGDKAGHVLGYWGGLMKDSMGYDLGGIGLWYGTIRSTMEFLKIHESSVVHQSTDSRR